MLVFSPLRMVILVAVTVRNVIGHTEGALDYGRSDWASEGYTREPYFAAVCQGLPDLGEGQLTAKLRRRSIYCWSLLILANHSPRASHGLMRIPQSLPDCARAAFCRVANDKSQPS